MNGQPECVPFCDDTALGALAFSPDGQFLATAALNGGLAVRNTATFALDFAHLCPDGVRITGLAFSPDARRLAAACWDGTVYLVHRRAAPGPAAAWTLLPVRHAHVLLNATRPGAYPAWLSSRLVRRRRLGEGVPHRGWTDGGSVSCLCRRARPRLRCWPCGPTPPSPRPPRPCSP